jgi:hypothetical protein
MTLDLDLTAEVRHAFDDLRVSRTPNHALVIKTSEQTLKLELDGLYPEGKSLDDIAATLPSGEPRFIIIMPERVHPDGRKSYPIVLCSYCPSGLAPQVNVVYSNARTLLVKEFQMNLVWEVKKKLQLGDEELVEKFNTNKW